MNGSSQRALNPHTYTLYTLPFDFQAPSDLGCSSFSVDYNFELGTKLVCFLFVERLKYLERLSVCASARTASNPAAPFPFS